MIKTWIGHIISAAPSSEFAPVSSEFLSLFWHFSVSFVFRLQETPLTLCNWIKAVDNEPTAPVSEVQTKDTRHCSKDQGLWIISLFLLTLPHLHNESYRSDRVITTSSWMVPSATAVFSFCASFLFPCCYFELDPQRFILIVRCNVSSALSSHHTFILPFPRTHCHIYPQHAACRNVMNHLSSVVQDRIGPAHLK